MNQCLVAAMTIAFRMNVLHSERQDTDGFLRNVTAHSQLQASTGISMLCAVQYNGHFEGTKGENKVCCHESCKQCGGEGCGEDGNANKCCTTQIIESKKLCSAWQMAPCVLMCDQGDGTAIPGLVGDNRNLKVCCPLECGQCGGRGCSDKGPGADACCVDNLAKSQNNGMCSESKKAPCVLKKPEPASVCSVGDKISIPGLVGEDETKQQKVCCPLACGQCGGHGCSKARPGADACCVDNLAKNKKNGMCSQSKKAPCVLKKSQPEPQQCNDLWKGFIGESANGGKVCCPEECGQCGGPDCGQSGLAAKCCVSNVLAGGQKKQCSNTQGPPCVLKFSSADGLLAGSAAWVLPVLLAIASTQHS